MMALFWALKYFLQQFRGYHVLVRVDKTAVVSYINHQGRLRSRRLNRLAQQVLLWAQDKFLSLRAIYIPGHMNVGADLLSRQAVTHGEWKLSSQSNLGEILQSGGGPLCFTGDSTMSPLLLSDSSSSLGSGRYGPYVAQTGSLRISPDRSAPGSPGEDPTTGVSPLTVSAPLADQNMVLRSNIPPRRLAVGDPDQERSPISGTGDSISSPARALEPSCLAPEGDQLRDAGLPPDVVETIFSSFRSFFAEQVMLELQCTKSLV